MVIGLRTPKDPSLHSVPLWMTHREELPSFKKTEEQCETKLDYWIYMLKNMETSTTNLPCNNHIQTIKELEQAVRLASMNKEDRAEYEANLRNLRDHWALEHTHQRETKEAREEGLKEGRHEGRHEEKYENARKMKQRGYPVEEIQEITGLSPETIEGL